MAGNRLRALACSALCAGAAALALPAFSGGHQVAELTNGTITINGDQASQSGEPKPNDLITVDYDAGKDELIFGQDIFDGRPAQCDPDGANPQRVFHCPASLITTIRIASGGGSDEVDVNIPPGKASVLVLLGSGNDAFHGGAEVDKVSGGSGSDKAYGGGNDDVLFGNGDSDKLLGEGGDDVLSGGPAPDKLIGGSGKDRCDSGSGSGKQISC
jgi:Ca2+-binding RTX toxin-like protein